MSYRDAIPDILPCSTWIGADGDRVLVRTAAARHVSYASPFGPMVLHEIQFRASFRPLYDRAAIRSQFSMSLANLGEFRVFWLPEHRRIMVRSVSCTRRFAVPDGALLVGVYSHPCKPDAFFEALDEVIRAEFADQGEKARAA